MGSGNPPVVPLPHCTFSVFVFDIVTLFIQESFNVPVGRCLIDEKSPWFPRLNFETSEMKNLFPHASCGKSRLCDLHNPDAKRFVELGLGAFFVSCLG